MTAKRIEDYRPGYPQFSALVASYEPYFVCRSFKKLRARLLLLKQDKLSILEQQLEDIDQQERHPLFLGKSRCDENTDRIKLLSDCEFCLADYDQMVKKTHFALSFDHAQERDVQSLQNWVSGTGSLAREETAYLDSSRDLVTLAPPGDNATVQLEAWVEDKMIRFYRGFRERQHHDVSTDANVYIYSGFLVKRTARALLLMLVLLLLLLPLIICNLVSNILTRVLIIAVFTVLFLIVLLQLTRLRTVELVMAGTTYAAFMVVFVSGTSSS